MLKPKDFVCYFYFIDWKHFAFGVSLSLHEPNIEIHLPFGFIRIGRPSQAMDTLNCPSYYYKAYGYGVGR